MFSCHHLIYSMHIRQFLLCLSKNSVKISNRLLLEQLIIWKKKRWKVKIVKISLKNTLKSMIVAGFFSNDIGANIFQIIFDIDFCFGNYSETRKKSKLLVVLNLTPICTSKKVQYSDEWFVCIVVTGQRDNLF
jgi:hypothetical protein